MNIFATIGTITEVKCFLGHNDLVNEEETPVTSAKNQ